MSHQFSLNPRKVPKKRTKHVLIETEIPHVEDHNVMVSCLSTEPSSMNNQLPIVWDKAIDYQVYDISGNTWIDFTSCIFVANVGHSNPDVVDAIVQTAKKGLLNAYYYPTRERESFTRNLLKAAGSNFSKVLILSTGAEAVEAAVKMCIMRGSTVSPTKRKIISFDNSFHGKTMGAQMVGGKPKEKQWISWQHPDIINIPFPYPWVLEEKKMSGREFFLSTMQELSVDPKDIAGFVSETYQGWCAVFLPEDYARAMRDFCDHNESLVVMDEVQAGFGRTGKLFAFEHLGIVPDIIVCGKAISSSLPLSAVITREDFTCGNQSFNSTHGGNPIAVAASDASLNYLIKNDLTIASEKKGFLLDSMLRRWQEKRPDHIQRIYCKGLLASVFINSKTKESNEDFVDRLIERAFYKGLISVRTGSGTLKIGPPLTIPEDALIEGVEILKECLEELIAENNED
jgi:4-aminobutyrate aminotransferase-like enzyme